MGRPTKTRINKKSNNNPKTKQRVGSNRISGIYIGEVINTIDVSRTGRIKVFISTLSQEKNDKSGYFDAIWTSPFAGSTNPRKIGKEFKEPDQTISSYGMWMVPPDLGNQVLVAFGDGNTKFCFIISCLYPDMYANMVPGIPAGKNYQDLGKLLPTVEKNKKTADITHNDTFRPVSHTLSESIVKQGLVTDGVRGATSSGSRRESPSEVFGFLTPGTRKSDITKDDKDWNVRLSGHQFVMDDSSDNKQIRIRSSEGNQILLDDNEGIIYLINKSGRAWVEMNSLGDIHIFGEGSINMRAKQNFNLRADHNINIEAGKDIHLRAAGDMTGDEYVGEGEGSGGQIWVDAAGEIKNIARASIMNRSIEGDVQLHASGSVKAEAAANNIELKSAKNTIIDTGEKTSIKAGGDVTMSGQQIVEKANKVLMNSGGADTDSAGINDAAELGNIPSVPQEDYTSLQPEYDADSEVLLPTGGKRTEKYQVKSIVGTMVTAEPFIGHTPSTPENENPDSIAPDESLADNMPNNSNGLTDSNGNSIPADVNTPGGFSSAIGYDASGNPIMNAPNKDIASNFGPASAKKLQETLAIGTALTAATANIKPLMSPTKTPGGYKMISINKKMDDFSATVKQVGVDITGKPADISSGAIAGMRKDIASSMNTAKSGGDVMGNLQKKGIAVIKDGKSTIYQDASGNKLVDFSKGLGKTSNSLIAGAELNATADVVSGLVGGVQMSDNQFAATTLMANHVGTDNFKQSRTLKLIQGNNFAPVPNSMLDFNKGTVGNSGKVVTRQDYVQRGQYYGELFQTPDSIQMPSPTGIWGTTASQVKAERRSRLYATT